MTTSKITDKTAYLEVNFPECEPISKAPTYSELEEKAKQLGISYDELVRQERMKRYTSMDKNDNVFLIQNPAVWESTYNPGGNGLAYVKPKPIPLLNNKIRPRAKTEFNQI